jgi:alanine dehydrogenase
LCELRQRRTVYIGEEEVKKLLTIQETIEAVETAFREKALGNAIMPPKLIIPLPDGDLRAMPAYLKCVNLAGVKVVNSHPKNRALGLPTVMAIIIAVDPKTGFPIAVIEATHLTAMRTAAAGAIAVKLLARSDSSVVALIGAGTQARYQLLALNAVMKRIDEVHVWSLDRELADSLVEEMQRHIKANFVIHETAREAVSGADIIVTATPSRTPIVMSDWVNDGVHINAIGADAPGKQELDPALLKRARIFLDDWAQGIESGEVNVPLREGLISTDDISGEIGDVLIGRIEGRRDKSDVTIFSSTGLAIQDIATASVVLRKLNLLTGESE